MAHVEKITSVRYTLAGKRVPSSTPGATATRQRSRYYYGVGVPGHPPAARVKLATDRAVAQRLLDDLVRDAERGRAGLPDRTALARPLSDHLDAYAEALALGMLGTGGRVPSADHAAIAASYPRAVLLDGCQFRTPADLGPPAAKAVARFLARKVAAPKSAGGWSHQTAKLHLAGCRRFARWLAGERVPVAADLFDGLSSFDPGNNRTFARREPTPAEVAALLTAARGGKSSFGLSGEERYHLYLTAGGTGFRVGELASLVVGSFALDADPPVVVLAGKNAKNRRGARQPVPPGVARQLRAWLAGRAPKSPAWPAGSWSSFAARMLRVDLAAAGVPEVADTPSGPGRLDFHALRHGYVSALAAANVGPKELQELARHSDPRLTLGVYTHLRAGALADAVGRLEVSATDIEPTRDELATTVAALVVVLVALLVALPARIPTHPDAR